MVNFLFDSTKNTLTHAHAKGIGAVDIEEMYGVFSNFTATKNPIYWINLREEPIIFINGRSYVLRDVHHPMHNMKSYKGIAPASLEALESKMKAEVLEEARTNEGKILVYTSLCI
jgi:hypothetical protein